MSAETFGLVVSILLVACACAFAFWMYEEWRLSRTIEKWRARREKVDR